MGFDMTRLPLEWERYINAPADADTVHQCRLRCALMFRDQREALRELCVSVRPKRIGCLGAGCLNDIPIETFLRTGSEVYLVDWIPRISEEGFRSDVIQREGASSYCFIRELQPAPERFCGNFSPAASGQDRVCNRFLLEEGPRPRCANYSRSAEPHFLEADVTLGRATAFARRVERWVGFSKTPAQAFRKAIDELRRCSTVNEKIAIPADSLDLVTSSMVVSQFDHEPYTFFSKLLALQFGSRLLAEEERLLPLMERLRSGLFRIQVEGHIREIYRLVEKRRGRVFFSVELFCSSSNRDEFFLVQEIHQVMDMIGKYFHFDFHLISPDQSLRMIETHSGTSIVQSYVLRPKEKMEQSSAPV